MLAGISIVASEARKKKPLDMNQVGGCLFSKKAFFSLRRRFAFGTPNTTHSLTSFHLHGDDKSHYKMEMNGVLI